MLSVACTSKEEPIRIVEPSVVPVVTEAPSPTATPSPTPSPTPTPAPTPIPDEVLLRQYIDTMTAEEKIGQLCMFGFNGTDTVSDSFSEIMDTYHVGNAILYGHNISRGDHDGGFLRCASLTESLQEQHDGYFPLLISIDVEGGSVTRFSWDDPLSSARTLGRRNDPDRAFSQFSRIGASLCSVGIQIDLAPVLDISHDPENSFLGNRILSDDLDTVCSIGLACIEGLNDGGALAFCKHFPGHGAANTDSHDAIPVTNVSEAEFYSYHLAPFVAAIEQGVDGILVNHVLYQNIDPDHIATQSTLILTDLLRTELGFDGVVMSDDFRMAALRRSASLGDAAVRFLLAGGDLILCGANHSYQREILEGLQKAVQDGTIPMERLNESVYRILKLKCDYFSLPIPSEGDRP